MGHRVRIRSLEALDPAIWGYLASSGGVVGKKWISVDARRARVRSEGSGLEKVWIDCE